MNKRLEKLGWPGLLSDLLPAGFLGPKTKVEESVPYLLGKPKPEGCDRAPPLPEWADQSGDEHRRSQASRACLSGWPHGSLDKFRFQWN